MATTDKKPSYKIKSDPVLQTRDSIEAQTAAFLQAGGRIQQIANGISGRTEAVEPRPAATANKKATPPKAGE